VIEIDVLDFMGILLNRDEHPRRNLQAAHRCPQSVRLPVSVGCEAGNVIPHYWRPTTPSMVRYSGPHAESRQYSADHDAVKFRSRSN